MEAQDEHRWYVVQTYAGYENRVKANLEQRIATMGMEKNIFNVLVPVEERVFVKEGKSRKVSRKLRAPLSRCVKTGIGQSQAAIVALG